MTLSLDPRPYTGIWVGTRTKSGIWVFTNENDKIINYQKNYQNKKQKIKNWIQKIGIPKFFNVKSDIRTKLGLLSINDCGILNWWKKMKSVKR